MRREVGTYFIFAVLVGIVLFLAYLFNLPLTGFAVFQQQTQTDFDAGNYTGTTEYNGSAVVLSSGQTSGTYISKIFDANDSTQWNTLTWQGGIPGTYSVFLTSATHKGSSVTEVASKDEDYYLADMSNLSNFDLDFDSDLTSGSILKIYARQNKSEIIGIYAQSDSSGSNPLGVFTVTSATGEWINVSLNIQTSTSAIWLGEGSGSGTAPQEEFDYIFAEADPQADLTFQVRSCSSSDCINVSFVDADLSDIKFLGQYFQYKVDFSTSDPSLSPFLENVVINSSSGIVSVTISEPNGTKSSQTGIPIQFAATGLNLNCWYNIDNGENVTLTDCSDSSFNVPDDGSYVFNLYVNNSLGAYDYQSSTFSVDTPAPSSESDESTEEEESSIGGATGQVTQGVVIQLTLSEIQDLFLSPGDSEQLSLSSRNTAITPLTSCVLTSIGDFADWISLSAAEEQNLNPGDEIVYSFDLTVPANQELGQYTLILQVKCDNFIVKEDFLVDVVAPSAEEEIDVGEVTPVGGFVIFGEDGIIGTGGIVILIIVVLVLAAILFIVRQMRKSGKTLKDVFNDLKFKFNDFKVNFKRLR